MKKRIEIMATLIVAFVLAGSVVGCGQAAPDQGEVDTTDNTEADEQGEGEANAEADGTFLGSRGRIPPAGCLEL